eukprot:SAG31_NODE_3208_length_4552_cov_5.626993_2_plen_190_part_00
MAGGQIRLWVVRLVARSRCSLLAMPTRGRQPDWSADGPHQFDEFLLKYLSDIDAPTKTKLMVSCASSLSLTASLLVPLLCLDYLLVKQVYTCNCVWLDLSLSAMEDMDKVALKGTFGYTFWLFGFSLVGRVQIRLVVAWLCAEEILKKSYAHWLSPKYMGAVDWLEPGQKRKTGKPPAGFWAFDGKQDR